MHHDLTQERPLSIRKVAGFRTLLGLASTSLVLASCSSGASAIQSTSANQRSRILLERAITNTKDAPSFELYLKVNATTGPLKGASVTFSGVYGTSYGQKEARVLCTYVKAGSPTGATANIRTIGQNTFLDPIRHSIPLPNGATWLHTRSMASLASYLSSFWPLFSSDGRFDPIAILSDLQYSDKVYSGGTTSFGGVTQHVYSLPASFSPINTNTSSATVSLDVSSKAYISRLSLDSTVFEKKSNNPTRVSMLLEIFSYAIPVNVSPPASSTVSSV